jgi:hypothetical protein
VASNCRELGADCVNAKREGHIFVKLARCRRSAKRSINAGCMRDRLGCRLRDPPAVDRHPACADRVIMPTAAYDESTRGSGSLQQGSAAMRVRRRSAYRTDGSSAAAMSAVDVTSVGASRSSSLNVRTTGCMSACGRGCAVWRIRRIAGTVALSAHRCCHKGRRLALRGEADFAAFCGEAARLRCRYTREGPIGECAVHSSHECGRSVGAVVAARCTGAWR